MEGLAALGGLLRTALPSRIPGADPAPTPEAKAELLCGTFSKETELHYLGVATKSQVQNTHPRAGPRGTARPAAPGL